MRNAGQLSIGGEGAAGGLYNYGDYTQTDTGRLDIELGGLTPEGGHDYFYIDGAAALDGELSLGLLDGYRPNAGDSLIFLTTKGGITGDFTAFTGTDLGGGLALLPYSDGFSYHLWTYAT